ncbi:DUF2497 domain-containing protein [Microvirga sp. Marseille-Q2068]|uniref:DUF2497 domain-containing protein n=2 Tax=Microvirga mediterraneensis TaxID=2754695 RepID=A0A838BQ49_9HYPH|nr:DUF2497 domain-containing protein [Microvirga mediterraneensis]
MEEILASIRRIIADDEVDDPSEADEPRSSPLSNVLDIAELHVSPLIASGGNEPVLGPWSRGEALVDDIPPGEGLRGERDSHPERDEPMSVPAAAHVIRPRAAAPVVPSQSVPADALMSTAASASVSDAFDRLGAALRPSQPQTVDDLMKEMLRPMLKAWLDDNLPSLVERLVRDEIERVTRSRG